MAPDFFASTTAVLPPPPDPARLAEPHCQELIEALLATLAGVRPTPLRARLDTLDETLLDLEWQGQHYLLVRRRPCPPAPHSLSPRELAIARLVARGLPNKAIGDVLDISPWTVATHLRRVYSKLDVTTRAAMVAALTAQRLL